MGYVSTVVVAIYNLLESDLWYHLIAIDRVEAETVHIFTGAG